MDACTLGGANGSACDQGLRQSDVAQEKASGNPVQAVRQQGDGCQKGKKSLRTIDLPHISLSNQ